MFWEGDRLIIRETTTTREIERQAEREAERRLERDAYRHEQMMRQYIFDQHIQHIRDLDREYNQLVTQYHSLRQQQYQHRLTQEMRAFPENMNEQLSLLSHMKQIVQEKRDLLQALNLQ